MLISRVSVEVLEIPFRVPLETAAGTWRLRRVGLVRLATSDGLEGIGEVASDRPGGFDAVDPVILTGSLVGLDAADEVELAERLRALDARPGIGRPLRSAVESALVDLLARASGRSVAAWLVDQPVQLSHEPRRAVRLNAFFGIGRADHIAQMARQYAADGYTCLKLKADNDPIETIVQRLAAVRSAVGPAIGLRLDFNGSLPVLGAQRVLDAVAPFGLEYVEQPIAASAGIEAMARLRRASPIAIAVDESVEGPESAGQLLRAGAADVLVLKPARVGGLLSAARIARHAAGTGTRTILSTMFETGIGVAGALHVAASLPGDEAHGLATLDLLAADLLVQSLSVAAGRMSLPAAPGLGVELDLAAVEGWRRR